MNQIKKIIAFLDQIPEGKELSIRQQITLVLWGLTIILIPFTSFPFGVFQKLVLYPLLGIVVLNVDKLSMECFRNKYLRYTALAIAAFIAWQIVTLPFSVGLKNIVSENVRPSFGMVSIFGAWYIFLATCFILPKEKVLKTFYWSLTVTLLYCTAYSIIEILHFCHVQWATAFLKKAIFYFIADLEADHGWWPPVLWDSTRLRAVFCEPSYYSIILIFSMLYYGFCAWAAQKRRAIAGNVILMVIAALMLCGTRSASGSLAAISSTGFFVILFALFFRNFSLAQKIKGAVLMLVFAALSSGVVFCQRGGLDDWQQISETLTKSEQSDQFATSSGTRYIHLKTELRLIAQNPVFGCGQGRYNVVMKEGLINNPEKTGEIKLWTEKEDSYPPRLNKYTYIALEYGIPGLLLFFAIFVPVFVGCIKSFKRVGRENWIASLVLVWPLMLTCCTINCNIFNSICFLIMPFFFFISNADGAESKTDEFSA